MKALVAYESMYGNTAAIGEAIAASLRGHGVEVDAGPISRIDPVLAANADLLVVGGPTHAHGMSREGSRQQAAQDKANTYAARTVEPGLREWIDALPDGAGRLAAAFDTRIDKPVILTGSAAKGIAKRLGRRGYRLVVGAECFLVTMQNRLIDGETDHAAAWGISLAEGAAAGAAR
jgi:flavodoxin